MSVKAGSCSVQRALFDLRLDQGLDVECMASSALVPVNELQYLENHPLSEYAGDLILFFRVFGVDIEATLGAALNSRVGDDVDYLSNPRQIFPGFKPVMDILWQIKSATLANVSYSAGLSEDQVRNLSVSVSEPLKSLELLLSYYAIDMASEVSKRLLQVKLMPLHLDITSRKARRIVNATGQYMSSAELETIYGHPSAENGLDEEVIFTGKDLGELLAMFRRSMGKTSKEVCAMAKISAIALHGFENGLLSSKCREVFSITQALDIDFEGNLRKMLLSSLKNPPNIELGYHPVTEGFGLHINRVWKQLGYSILELSHLSGLGRKTLLAFEKDRVDFNGQQLESLLGLYQMNFSKIFALMVGATKKNIGILPADKKSKTQRLVDARHSAPFRSQKPYPDVWGMPPYEPETMDSDVENSKTTSGEIALAGAKNKGTHMSPIKPSKSHYPKEYSPETRTLGEVLIVYRKRLRLTLLELSELLNMPVAGLNVFELSSPTVYLKDFIALNKSLGVNVVANIKIALAEIILTNKCRANSVGKYDISFHECFSRLRQNQNVKITDLSRISGVSQQSIKSLEMGVLNRQIQLFERLLYAYGVEFSDVFRKSAVTDILFDDMPLIVPVEKPPVPAPIQVAPQAKSADLQAPIAVKSKITLKASGSFAVSAMDFDPETSQWKASVGQFIMIARRNSEDEVEVSFMGCTLTGFKDIAQVKRSIEKIASNVFKYLSSRDCSDSSWPADPSTKTKKRI